MILFTDTFGIPVWLLAGLGYSVAFLGGLFGIGGGWILTPVLILLGMPAVSAVGTGFPFIFASSILSLLLHRKARQVNLQIGVTLAVAAMAGVIAGSRLVSLLQSGGNFEASVRIVYAVFLGLVGSISLISGARKAVSSDGLQAGWTRKDPSRTLVFSVAGLVVGLFSGFLGVGGGLMLFPFLTVVAGFNPALAAGTSLIGVWLSSLTGTAAYLMDGRVAWIPFFWLILPAAPASWLGVKASRILPAGLVKPLFGGLVLAGSAAMVLTSLGWTVFPAAFLYGIAALVSVSVPVFLLMRKIVRQ